MNDLVERLRDRAYSNKFVDTLLAHAADEIERLRKRTLSGCETVTLTDAERDAVRFFSLIDGPGNVPVANKKAATLRGLLARLA